MKILLVYFAIFFTFYILGAYSTTDILRLLKGATLPVNAPICCCPICNKTIALRDQLPIFSYLKNHGLCKNCGSRIPLSDLFLEIFLFLLLSVIAITFRYSWIGYGLCIFSYELTKIVFLIRFQKRENAFLKNLAVSLLNNICLFGILAFFFSLKHLT
jgi:leader peptidase (prepilin peptidase)/N-methyltransferase